MKTETKLPVLAIVVPCYNEEEVMQTSPQSLLSILEDLIVKEKISVLSHILFVDDGSKDRTWQMIDSLHGLNPKYRGLKLASNVGHQNALMAGLTYSASNSDVTVSIDVDLQDDISVIEDMVDAYLQGHDIVYGVRKSRNTDTFFKRTTAQGFYKVMEWLGTKTVYNHADYRLMSSRAIRTLLRFEERNLYLRGIVPLIGYPSTCVYYSRSERTAGESKYPLGKMIELAFDGITSFSVKPLHFVLYLGIISTIVSALIMLWVFIQWFGGVVFPGWTSLILTICFCSGCILMALGVVGEYIGKLYIEVKRRPRFNVEKVLDKCNVSLTGNVGENKSFLSDDEKAINIDTV